MDEENRGEDVKSEDLITFQECEDEERRETRRSSMKRDNPEALANGGANDKRKRLRPHKDTDASLASLNLLQPFNVPQYRFTPVLPFEAVTLSPFDRAPQLRLTKDAHTVSGYKGYRLIRGTHGVCQGAWYCEATVMDDFQDTDLEERLKLQFPKLYTLNIHKCYVPALFLARQEYVSVGSSYV
jgi:hypothetical protein